MLNRSSKAERAKLFMPFDSLKGFQDHLREKERILVDKKLLSEYDCEQLNTVFMQIKKMDIVKVVYYECGEYIEVQGIVTNFDFEVIQTIQVVEKVIPLHDIIEITILK